MSRCKKLWGRLLRDRRTLLAGGALLALLAAVTVLPMLLQLEPNLTDAAAGFWAPPSRAHWLGTDDVGRDVFARLVYGGRTSLLVGLASAALSMAVGVPLGLLAGYRRGVWEVWIMRCADVFQSFPSLVLTLCVVNLLGASVGHMVAIIGLLGWASIARLVYGNTLAVREKEYILAARALGATHGMVICRNVLPNVIAPVWPAVAQRVVRAMLSESSLSFLGVGIRPPQASWGNLMQHAASLSVLTARPWIWLPPGLLIVLTTLCLQLLGDGLRDVFDPRFTVKTRDKPSSLR